jgi:hypothetical protein
MIRLFFRGWLIVSLTAANVSFIGQHNYPLAFVTGFGISLVWYGNSQRANDHRTTMSSWVYALGAAAGTMTGMWVGGLLR